MRSVYRALLGLTALALAACAPSGPQSRLDRFPHTETWRSPYPTPFGTAGLEGIPPRPSHSPLVWRVGPSASPTTAWITREAARAAIARFQPRLPADAEELPEFFARAYGRGCPTIDRMVATADLDTLYFAFRGSLIEMGLVITGEDHRPRNGPFAEILWAVSPTLSARVSAGTYVPEMWATGRSVRRPFVVRVEFDQRCA